MPDREGTESVAEALKGKGGCGCWSVMWMGVRWVGVGHFANLFDVDAAGVRDWFSGVRLLDRPHPCKSPSSLL